MKRLFLALWPDDKSRQQCAKIATAIQTEKVSPVKPSNIHITLIFLGNLDLEKETHLKQALVDIHVPRITLTFDRLSFWKKPGIICLTTTGLSVGLATLVEDLSMPVKKLEILIDERPYNPHITLIKKAKKLKVLEFPPIIWHSESFCLVESCSTPNGVEYRVIGEWPTNRQEGRK